MVWHIKVNVCTHWSFTSTIGCNKSVIKQLHQHDHISAIIYHFPWYLQSYSVYQVLHLILPQHYYFWDQSLLSGYTPKYCKLCWCKIVYLQCLMLLGSTGVLSLPRYLLLVLSNYLHRLVWKKDIKHYSEKNTDCKPHPLTKLSILHSYNSSQK